MNPFNYSLSEVRKALIALVFLVGYAVTLFVAVPVGLTPAIAALVGPVFMVIGVFAAKHHSPDDLQKALEAFKGAALTVAVYFTTVPASTANKLGVLIGAIVAVVTVYWKANGSHAGRGVSPDTLPPPLPAAVAQRALPRVEQSHEYFEPPKPVPAEVAVAAQEALDESAPRPGFRE